MTKTNRATRSTPRPSGETPAADEAPPAAARAPRGRLGSASQPLPARAAQQSANNADVEAVRRFRTALTLYAYSQRETPGSSVHDSHKRRLLFEDRIIKAMAEVPPHLRGRVGLDAHAELPHLGNRMAHRDAMLKSEDSPYPRFVDQFETLRSKIKQPGPGTHLALTRFNEAAEGVNGVFDIHAGTFRDCVRAIELRQQLAQQAPAGNPQVLINQAKTSFAVAASTKLYMLKGYLECLAVEHFPKPEAVSNLLRQQQALLRYLGRAFPNEEMFELDDFVADLAPLLHDSVNLCLDYCASALGADELPANDDEGRLLFNTYMDAVLRHCMEWIDLAGESRAIGQHLNHPGSAGQAAERKLVVVRSPDGVHVPARLQHDGTAVALEPNGGRYMRGTDGSFGPMAAPTEAGALTPDEDEETGAEETLDSRLAAAFVGMVLKDKPVNRPRSVEILEKGLALIALTDKDLTPERTFAGVIDPDMLCAGYAHHAGLWRSRAVEMRALADRLERFKPASFADEEQRATAQQLPERLRLQASRLDAQSKEFTGTEKRHSLLKAYIRPQSHHWAELLAAGEIERVGPLRALPSAPSDTVFELAIHPKPDSNGAAHPPVFLHLHSRQPLSLQEARDAATQATPGSPAAATTHAHFDAVHLKSDIEKNRGAAWLEAQRAKGNLSVTIHRSTVDPHLLRALMLVEGRTANGAPAPRGPGA